MYHWLFALSFLIAMLLADFAAASVHWDEMLVKHSWNAVPAGWESLGNTTAGAVINFHIALTPERESALIDVLSEVSNPRHPRYGAYLSSEQVAELVSPHPDTLDLIRAWLVHHGIRPSSISTTHGGEWLTLTDVLVSQANQLLDASFQLYRNSKTNVTIVRTLGYALPVELHKYIRTVEPTTYFPTTRGIRQTALRRSFEDAPGQAEAASGKIIKARENRGITPSMLQWLYKTEGYSPSAPPGLNKLGVLGIDQEYPNIMDMVVFMAKYRRDAMDARFSVVQWNGGGYNPRKPTDVASIDIQYATALGYPAKVTFYSIGGEREWDHLSGEPIVGDVYLEWLNRILALKSPPRTISISYSEYERDLPVDYAKGLCRLFAQLGARGITVLAASGKDGVGAGYCLDIDGNVQFTAEFPSSCPHVTSVGGTTNFRPEMAANISGGGFSYYFPRPDYQNAQVIRYLMLYPEFYPGYYNRNGRGYPDISAQALNYEVIVNGQMFFMDGTACAVSTVAGILSLVNDLLAAKKRHPLGFVNPFLYAHGSRGIKDILFGGNPGCNTTGFVAEIGWDPVTGLGTLDFEGILGILFENWGSSDEEEWDGIW